jgi:diaminopimelate epimerase
VEDFTLACGTGCGSIASTLWLKGQLPGGVLTARNKGGTLTVTIGGENGVIRSIELEGPTEVVKLYEL